MVVVSRSILKFGAGLLSSRASRRLRRRTDAGKVQTKVFKNLIPKLARALVWRGAGIESGMSHGDFLEKVPLRTYEGLSPHIERMKKGDANILWPLRQIYSVSSGTTAGRTKLYR